jgi:ABC-type lipoprotein export system ATPase subunit
METPCVSQAATKENNFSNSKAEASTDPVLISSYLLAPQDSKMSLIELHEVSKIYDLGEVKVEALKNASLTIEQGEYVALMGPSGSGKSTLMNTLGCLDRPTSGSYRLAGEEVVDMSRDQLAGIRNRSIGFVFQNFNLLARTSAVENVELPLLYSAGVSARQRRRLAIEALEQVGLGDRLDHHPSQLSGGQQQRVAIARALINTPSILLADEPTGNLDSRTSKEVIQLFSDLNERNGITIILVTHDQAVAHNAKRIIMLHDGGIIEDTTDLRQAMRSLNSAEDLELAD